MTKYNSRGIIVVLETKCKIVIVFVGIGTFGNSAHVINIVVMIVIVMWRRFFMMMTMTMVR